jgi:hypothetical protein
VRPRPLLPELAGLVPARELVPLPAARRAARVQWVPLAPVRARVLAVVLVLVLVLV